MTLGMNQLRLLIMTASPTCLLLTTDKVSASLVRRDLFVEREPGGACAITPEGLRALADAMACGRVDDALAAMKKDHAETQRKMAERRTAKAERVSP